MRKPRDSLAMVRNNNNRGIFTEKKKQNELRQSKHNKLIKQKLFL